MWQKVLYTFDLVKFSHTIFAMPFALAAYFIATQGRLEPKVLSWTILCLVLARTAAMAFNRLLDASIDAKNPRTQSRHIPAGSLSRTYVLSLVLVCSLGFILAASQLNRLALYLSPLCLLILFLYSFTKRFTHYTQVILGLGLGMAPIGATVAALGQITLPSLILGLSVLFWVAGFDLLYSLQDINFDADQGLYSLAVKLGVQKSFLLAKVFHGIFILCLAFYGYLEGLGGIYWAGILVTAGLLIWEHWLLKDDLNKIQAAFFTANGLLSMFFFAFVMADIYL